MSTTMILSKRLFPSSFIAVANFTNVSSDTTLLEGQDLQLFCIASGRPDPNITWVRISPSGVVSDVLHRGTTWDFKNISRAEASIYSCIASNGVEDPVSHIIDVSVILYVSTSYVMNCSKKKFVLSINEDFHFFTIFVYK